MSIYKDVVEADVRIGEGVVSIRRKGSSEVVQANIVASDYDESGQPTRLWLDRLVHAIHETEIGGHPVNGAFVTELALPNRKH
jgi:hypothetical protein